MIQEILRDRGVPTIDATDAESMRAAQAEYRRILQEEEYGYALPEPESLSFEVIPPAKIDTRFAAGEATLTTVICHATVCGKEFSFPFQSLIPNKEGKHPFFVHMDFNDGLPTKYTPAEEIVNRGFAIFHTYYQNVTTDDVDFANGLAGILYDDPDVYNRAPTAPGKIAMWAWANMRVMDYAMTLDCLDFERCAVIGHSRLGKTALFTGMMDERFPYVIANNSGCSGDAITRGKVGEQIANITKHFPHWFCPNYYQYQNRHDALPFDQHQLIATIAPRKVICAAALEDTWADPDSQLLSCAAASAAWECFGQRGLVAPDRLPVAGDTFYEGTLRYHLRLGQHYLSRYDWNLYMNALLEA